MRRIEIDDEVYAWLADKAKGFEQPNDVLRRELLGSSAVAEDRSAKGRLWPLLEAGLIEAGDELRHDQPRKGRTHRGVVEADGRIRTEKGLYEHPSRALGDLVDTSISGPATGSTIEAGSRSTNSTNLTNSCESRRKARVYHPLLGLAT